MVSVQVTRGCAGMADEELGPAGIATRVGHRQYSTVVVLILTIEFAINGIARAPVADAVRAPALNDKVRDDTMERESIVKALFGQGNEVVNGFGSVLLKEFYLHDALPGMDFCCFHFRIWAKLN